MNPKIPLFDLEYNELEKNTVIEVLNSKWLTMGEKTKKFEVEFAKYIGVKYAFAVTNCTAALHIANEIIGVKDKEVIVPSLSFVATANSVKYAQGIPVFADVISENDWTICPQSIEEKITEKTKAIVVMHYAGFACQMTEIKHIAKKYNLKIIEDCAHSPGSELDGKKLGNLGDISCFSFFTNKNLSTGEGGMICTNNNEYAEKIKLLRSHGMTSLTLDRHKGHAFSYDVVELGYNYRIDEIRSALGLVQLEKLDRNNALRNKKADLYKSILNEEKNILIPFTERKEKFNYHIFPVKLGKDIDRNYVVKQIREFGIQTSIHYKPIHLMKYYNTGINLPLTENISFSEITLPMYPALEENEIEFISKKLIDICK